MNPNNPQGFGRPTKPDIDVRSWRLGYNAAMKDAAQANKAIFNRLAAEAVDGATYHSPGLSNNTKVLPISKLKAIMEIKE